MSAACSVLQSDCGIVPPPRAAGGPVALHLQCVLLAMQKAALVPSGLAHGSLTTPGAASPARRHLPLWVTCSWLLPFHTIVEFWKFKSFVRYVSCKYFMTLHPAQLTSRYDDWVKVHIQLSPPSGPSGERTGRNHGGLSALPSWDHSSSDGRFFLY